MSVMRAFLNRILAVGSATDETGASESVSAIEHALRLGDEVTDGEQALEAGGEFPATKAADGAVPEDAARRQAVRRRANREQILGAVETFNDRVRDRARSGALNPFDALRLRAMLMVVAASGYHVTGLDAEELLSGDVHAVFEALSERFAERLGLDPAKLESAHLAAVAAAREQEPAFA